ncbi:MAG: hypothetical protein ABFD97_16835 [Syntrophobacter sp.]
MAEAKRALLSIPPVDGSVPAVAGNSFGDILFMCIAPVIDRKVMALLMLVSITEALEKDQVLIDVVTLQ